MTDLFPALPESLPTEKSALSALLDELRSKMADALAASQPDATEEQRAILGELSADEIVKQFADASVAIAKIEETLATIVEGEKVFLAKLMETASESGVKPAEAAVEVEAEVLASETDGEGDGDGDGDGNGEPAEPVEPEAAVEEAVIASAELKLLRPPPAPSKDHQPIETVERKGAALVASVGVEGVAAGEELDRIGLAKAIMAARRQYTSAPAGFEEKAIVASARWELPEERCLFGDDFMGNLAKIDAVVGERAMGINPETGQPALIASGGLCAPVNNYYELMMISSAQRPVRDALVGFQATRGGIKAAATPTLLSGVTTAVGSKTVAQDGGGGTLANKTCQTIPCPSFTEVDIQMIYHCITVGNIISRTFPEQVAAFQDLVLAAHARLAEGLLLDALKAGSTQVTQAAVNGANSTLLGGILQAVAGMRSRHRTDPNMRFRAIFPAWIKPLLVEDLVRQQFDRFSRDEAGVVALLRMMGVEPSFTLDSETGGGMVFGAQGAGALLVFPTTVKWFLYPEGTWLYLDGGTLDLGIVRDSTLNTTNDFTIFGEVFENAAKVGVESLEITTTLCPNGVVAIPATGVTCP